MKYYVTIEEMVSKAFEVETDDACKVAQITERKYKCGEFILDPGNLVCKQMMVEDENNISATEWMEF